MKDIILICGILAVISAGYFAMKKLDYFMVSHRELYCKSREEYDQEQRR